MQVIGYDALGSILIVVDGVEMTVPDDMTNRHRQMVAAWEAAGNVIPAFSPYSAGLDEAKAQKLAELDNYRWEREVGGVGFAGAVIRTDWNSQAKITAAYTMARLDPDYEIPTWEVMPGVFMPLTNAQIVAMGEAVRDHVQSTFDRKAELHAMIAALDTVGAVAAFDIAAEW